MLTKAAAENVVRGGAGGESDFPRWSAVAGPFRGRFERAARCAATYRDLAATHGPAKLSMAILGNVTSSALDDAIDALARDVMPTIHAVRTEPHRVPPTGIGLSGLWLVIDQAILGSPAFRQAEQAVREDPMLGPVDRDGQVYVETSFGSGEPLQAAVLPLNLIQAACIELLVCGRDLTADTLAQTSVDNLAKLRTGLAGNEFQGWCVIAFSTLPEQTGTLVRSPWGDLVGADRLTGEIWNDPPGLCRAVLATPVPMKLELFTPGQPPPSTFSMKAYRIAQLVSYGLALGSNREDPATAVPLHTGGLTPWGMPGWGGEVRSLGFTSRSTPLTGAEATEAARWMIELDGALIDRIDVALRRLVRGLAERMDHADQLIDAVIAWENLVEHRDQPTASVLWGMRQLVGPSGWSRTRIEKVYETRSDVVHGEQPDYMRIREHAPQALGMGLDALRALIDHHKDTLTMSSEERVVALGYQMPEPPPPQ